MTDQVRAVFEQISPPAYGRFPVRVKIEVPSDHRRGGDMGARVGSQRLEYVLFSPQGTGLVGYLRRAPGAGDALTLFSGPIVLETGIRFQPPAGARSTGAESSDELLFDTEYSTVGGGAQSEALVVPPVDAELRIRGNRITLGNCTAERQPGVWTASQLVGVTGNYAANSGQRLDQAAYADLRRLRDAAVAEGVITADGPYLRVLSGYRNYDSEAQGWKRQLRGQFRARGAACNALWPQIEPVIDATSAALRDLPVPHGGSAWVDRFVTELTRAALDLSACGGSREAVARAVVTAGAANKAPPGRGRHMTGRAVDLSLGARPGTDSQTSTAEADRDWQRARAWYRWLVCNASGFNFHPYPYEPWHWEHVPPAS